MAAGERETHRVRDAVLGGDRSALREPGRPGPRHEIAASWRRMSAFGLDPGAPAATTPLTEAELEARRTRSGLADLVPGLLRYLQPATAAGQLVVIADSGGRVLWRDGGPAILRDADRLGFVNGSAWSEGNVGTNAIGTSLVLGESFHIRGAEHYVESHTSWGCAAAPLNDPWSGEQLGVVDVSGPARGLHPTEVALVEMAARLATMELVEQRRVALERLRVRAAPLLAGLTGDVIVVDRDGHVAAAAGRHSPSRIALPDDLGSALDRGASGTDGATIWLPRLGAASAEPLPGGWLLRLDGERESGTDLHLDLTGSPRLAVSGPSGRWEHPLSRRHAEILVALAAEPEGRSAAELADDLFADTTKLVTVRAEMSRLRRNLGGVLLAQPYRLAGRVTMTLPQQAADLLEGSSAPAVRRLREQIVRPA